MPGEYFVNNHACDVHIEYGTIHLFDQLITLATSYVGLGYCTVDIFHTEHFKHSVYCVYILCYSCTRQFYIIKYTI